MVNIDSYEELCNLPERSVVQDAEGHVWCVQHHVFGTDKETWLSPFSGEYSFSIKQDGSTYALGDTPALPITDLNIITGAGG